MEHGFYHQQTGYWQTVSDVPEEIFATYPPGTIEVPLKPGADYQWLDNKWEYVPPIWPTNEQQATRRKTAYYTEADPLYFMYQRGEVPEQQWLDKIAEIKLRFPYYYPVN